MYLRKDPNNKQITILWALQLRKFQMNRDKKLVEKTPKQCKCLIALSPQNKIKREAMMLFLRHQKATWILPIKPLKVQFKRN